MTYTDLVYRISSITHRSDLSSFYQDFINDANAKINNRLSLDLIAPTLANNGENNAVYYDQPLLYLYGALISAYEYINELDMALHYQQQWGEQISEYYITSVKGRCPDLVMGEPVCADTTSSGGDTPVATPTWILETGYWNDQGEWIDAAQWND